MKRISPSIAGVLALAIVTSSSPVRAGSFGGGTIIDISDGTPHGCIDVSANLVSMQLAVIQVDRHAGWLEDLFKKKKALGVKFDVTLTDADNKAFDFPRAKQVVPPPGHDGVAILPMQVSIMSKYRLSAGIAKDYVNAGMDIYFITVESTSDGMKLLTSLVDFTKSLPIPTNPYTTGISYFGDFANKIVSSTLKDGAAPNPDASFSFDLASTAAQAQACKYGYLKEGVQAVIFDTKDQPSANMINVANAGNYCFWYDPNANRVKYANRSGTCTVQIATNAQPLNNPLIAFVVSAVPAAATPVTSQAIQGAIPGAGATVSFSDPDIKKALSSADPLMDARISPGAVSDLLKLFDLRTTATLAETQRIAEHSTNQDVASAMALKRCAAAAIPAVECQ